MKNQTLIALIVMLASCWIAGWFGSWYAPSMTIMVVAFLLRLPVGKGMWTGAVSMCAIFALQSVWQLHLDHNHLADKIGALLGGLTAGSLIMVSAGIGLITGFISGWLGSALSRALRIRSMNV